MVLRCILSVAVYLLVGPFVAGIAYKLLLFYHAYVAAKAEYQAITVRDFFAFVPLGTFVFEFVVSIIGAYIFTWKAALAVGLVMGPCVQWVRLYPAVLALSLFVGAGAGVTLVTLKIWMPPYDPILFSALIGGIAAFIATWTLYHSRFLKPRRAVSRSVPKT